MSVVRGRGRAGTAIAVSALLACLLIGVAGLGWRLAGGSWAVISTPSMGTAAPVGTLVWIRTTTLAQLEVGDVITYRPPTTPDRLYTHRVVGRYPDGGLEVRGDINGASDPLPVHQRDLVGRVVATWKGIGWLVRALPAVLLAEVVLLVTTALYVPVRWRSSSRIVGTCLVVALAALLLRPFVHPVLIAVTDSGSGPVASVVSGGLFPTRVTGAPGQSIVLSTGRAGTVPVLATRPGGPVTINGAPDLHGWWLITMVAWCLLPLAWCTLVGLTPDDRDDEDGTGGDEEDDGEDGAAEAGHGEDIDGEDIDGEVDSVGDDGVEAQGVPANDGR